MLVVLKGKLKQLNALTPASQFVKKLDFQLEISISILIMIKVIMVKGGKMTFCSERCL